MLFITHILITGSTVTAEIYKTKLEELSDFIRITLSAVHEFRPAGNVKDLLTHLGWLAYKTNFRA
jgi:hypothetical protein